MGDKIHNAESRMLGARGQRVFRNILCTGDGRTGENNLAALNMGHFKDYKIF